MGRMRLILGCLVLWAACGGKAEVASSGTTTGTTASGSGSGSTTSGGGGSASTTTAAGAGGGSSSTTTTGTGAGGASMADCATLTKNYQDAFDLATKCNACSDFDPCLMTGSVVHTLCGCEVGGNGNKDAATAAEAAYGKWKSAGCGAGIKCAPCPPGGGKFACQTMDKSCNGHCTAI